MSNNAVSTDVKQQVQSVGTVLEKMKPQMKMVLPNHITPERLVRVTLGAVTRTPKLLECTRESLYMSVLTACQLGLEPDGILGQGYLVPFYDGKSKQMKVQFIPGYRGLIDLARRSGEVSNIIAKEVCKNDTFEVDFSQEIPFIHKPRLEGERGPVTHFWALARFKDGGFHWDYMTRLEVEEIRDNSQGYKASLKYAKRNDKGEITDMNSPWFTNFVEMGKKTMIRRIAKYLPMNVQKAAMIENIADAGKPVVMEEGELMYDADSGEVIEGQAEQTVTTSKGKLDNFAAEEKVEAQPTVEMPAEPPTIKVPTFPDDPQTADWETFAQSMLATIERAPDRAWLVKFINNHSGPLMNLGKLKPELLSQIKSAESSRMAEFKEAA